MEVLKFQSNQFKELVASKDQYTSELQKMVKLYVQSKKMKAAYEAANTNNLNDKELEKFLDEEKKYVTLMNDYAEKFANVNSQLEQFDEAKAKEVNNFLELVTLHKRINADIKTAEDLSRDDNGLQLRVIRRYGREKKIAVDLVDEYQALVLRKKAVAKEMTALYKKMSNIGEIKREEIIKPEPVIQTVPEITISQQPISNVENEDVDYWQNLSDEEKEKELAERLERIRAQFNQPGMGKKRLMSIDGQKIEVPVSLIGIYSSTKGRLAGIRAKIAEKSTINQAPTNSPYDDLPKNLRVVEFIPKKQEIVSIEKPKTNIFSKIKKKAALVVAAIVTVTAIGGGIVLSYINSSNSTVNEPTAQPTTVTQVYSPQPQPTNTPSEPVVENVLPTPTPAPTSTPVPTPTPSVNTYTVVKGDTLIEIARRYGTTYKVLAELNHIANPDLIFPDQVIILPEAAPSNVTGNVNHYEGYYNADDVNKESGGKTL
jgi:LysM repeat protein